MSLAFISNFLTWLHLVLGKSQRYSCPSISRETITQVNARTSTHDVSKRPCSLFPSRNKCAAISLWQVRQKVESVQRYSFLAFVKEKKSFSQLKPYRIRLDAISISAKLEWRGAQISPKLEVRPAELFSIYLQTDRGAAYHDFRKWKPHKAGRIQR